MDEEGLTSTKKDKIYIGQPIEVNQLEFFDKLNSLKNAVELEDENAVRYLMKDLVPTFRIKEHMEDIIAL